MDEPSRRRFLRRSLAAGAALTAGCLDDAVPATDTASTPTSGDGTTRVRTTPRTRSPATNTPADSPTPGETTPALPDAVAWSDARGSEVSTTPVVTGEAVYAGTRDGVVSRHATGDGSLSWTVDTGAPIRDLAVTADVVLAVSGTTELAADHTLYALDDASGQQQWTFSPTDWWLELLAARDGRVYVGTADDVLGERNETLYAVPVGSGGPAWDATIGDPREAVFDDDAIYVSTTGRVYAFATADGSKRWHAETPDPTYTTLATVDGTVVQGVDSRDTGATRSLVGFDAATGEERWRFDDRAVSSTTARGGDLYVGGAGVGAVDPADGTTVWASDRDGFVTDRGVDETRVYAGSDRVHAYDRESGEVAWTWSPDIAQGGLQAAGLSGGRLYLDAYRDGEPRNQYRFAIDPEAGESVWTFEDGTELTDLAVGDDAAAVGGENGRLYGFDLPVE